ncbi:hypothetical protein KUCAC02_019280, partial [Chaenocephalus aceratus]
FGLRVCESLQSLQLNSSSFIEMEDNREQLTVSSSDVPSEVPLKKDLSSVKPKGCKVHEFMIQLLKKRVQDGKLELERSLRRKKEEKMQEQASQTEEERPEGGEGEDAGAGLSNGGGRPEGAEESLYCSGWLKTGPTGVKPVTLTEWEKIDSEEVQRGVAMGKPEKNC